MELIPTILEETPEAAATQIIRLSPYFSAFQIDVVDGVFAPNKTPSVRELKLPDVPGLTYDFHLMTQDYEWEVADIKALSASHRVRNILIHADLSPNYHLLSMNFPQFTFGAVLNSEDSVPEAAASYNLKTLPLIQFMTVHIGAQGNPFIEQVLKKIEQIKRLGYHGKIFIDGSVNDETLPRILFREFRPDALCIGSFITKTPDLEMRVKHLKEHLQPFSNH